MAESLHCCAPTHQEKHTYLQYDRKHQDLEFSQGDWVWLRLLHRSIASLNVTGQGKLGPKFYGPFQVLQRVGDVTYKLQLPQGAHLHDVFHVGLLKKYCGAPPSSLGVLPPIRHGCTCLEPAEVSKCRLASGRHEVLVRWEGQPAAEASWMALEEFRSTYPSFRLGDELCLQGGRDGMIDV
jgi:hypothetical protein